MKAKRKDKPFDVDKVLDIAAVKREHFRKWKLFRKIDQSYAGSMIVVVSALLEVSSKRNTAVFLHYFAFLLRLLDKRTNSIPSVSMPPGHAFLKAASFFASKKFYTRVVEPLVADMREEYNEALFRGDVWAARRVRIRCTYSFLAAIGLDRVFAFVSFFVKAWKSVN